ncbi:MAG: FlgD immunoglobulin-like domain containing protein [Patescibacteria group bacterium]|jgi:hypothetical protein|nr:FlgD immunoglobulin-like domain containing protein [Patescibacteria group bacterium]
MKTKYFISVLLGSLIFFQNVSAQEWDKEYPELIESDFSIQTIGEMENGYVYANLGCQGQMSLLKIKKENGEIIWHQEHRITGYTHPNKIFTLADEKLLIIGGTDNGHLLLITDNLGNELKRNTWLPDNYTWGGLTDAVENGDSTYTALGFLKSEDGGYFCLVKFDQNLEILWEKAYLPKEGDVCGITIGKDDDDYVLFGGIHGQFAGYRGGLIKLDGEGNLVWQKTYPEHEIMGAESHLTVTKDGYLISGMSRHNYNSGPYCAGLIKIDKQGSVVWQNNDVLNSETSPAGMLGCWEKNNEYIGVIKGRLSKPYSSWEELHVVKMDASGNLIYQKKWEKLETGNAILTQDKFLLISGGRGIPWAIKIAVPENANIKNPLPPPTLAKNVDLKQNFPNPFNSATTIEYWIPKRTFVQIIIFDITGKIVKTFFCGFQEPGGYALIWNGKNDKGNFVASGAYIYQLSTDQATVRKKLILEK